VAKPQNFQQKFHKKFFSEQSNIGDLPPPPPPPPPPGRQKFFGHCTIFGVKKNFPEHSFGNTYQFLREYCTPTFISTTNCGLFGFFISHFTNTYGFSFERTDNIFANCIFVRIREIFKTNRETLRSARKPGDSRVNRETWQLCNLENIWPFCVDYINIFSV
jgi:hypothetical protein